MMRNVFLFFLLSIISCIGNIKSATQTEPPASSNKFSFNTKEAENEEHPQSIKIFLHFRFEDAERAILFGIRTIEIFKKYDIYVEVVGFDEKVPGLNPAWTEGHEGFYEASDPRIQHIFFIKMIKNEKEEELSGVKLTSPDGCNEAILITEIGADSTISHELGHAYGLDHTDEKDNIMNSSRDRKSITMGFNEAQIEIMKSEITKETKDECSL